MGEIMGEVFHQSIVKGLEWSGEPDAQPWDVFVPPENMSEIDHAFDPFEGKKVAFIIGRAGLGKDHLISHGLKHHGDYCQLFDEEKLKKKIAANIEKAIIARMIEIDKKRKKKRRKDFVYDYTEYSLSDRKQIVKEQFLTAYLGMTTIFQFPDVITSRREVKNRLKTITILFEKLRELAKLYYRKHGIKPRYKLLIFMMEEHAGPNLEHIKDLNIINKADIVFLKSYSDDLLMEMYCRNVVSPLLPEVIDMSWMENTLMKSGVDIVALSIQETAEHVVIRKKGFLSEEAVKKINGIVTKIGGEWIKDAAKSHWRFPLAVPLAVDETYLPFTEAGLRHIAQNSQGNPRRFKELIHDNLEKIRAVKYSEQHLHGLIDVEINIEDEDQERIELMSLYAGLDTTNARVTKYYPKVKRIIQENPDIDFKTQKQILACAVANYPHDFLNTRKISEVLKQIKEQNNVNIGPRRYKNLIYVDELGVFRL